MKLISFLLVCLLSSKAVVAEPHANTEITWEWVSFSTLYGWTEDNLQDALEAFRNSCSLILLRPPEEPFHTEQTLSLYGQVKTWQTICRAIPCEAATAHAIRSYFEFHFLPVYINQQASGTVRGYFEPIYHGSSKKTDLFPVPLLQSPPELFSCGKDKERYLTRAEIEKNLEQFQPLALAWLSPLDAYFAHIQGSVRVVLEDDRQISVGYEANNGHPYTSIAKHLVALGEIPEEALSIQAIREWAQKNPGRLSDLLYLNNRYVFFYKKLTDTVLGAEKVSLTPGRSAAIDRHYYPFGAPIWISSSLTLPVVKYTVPLRRLVIAQDMRRLIKGAQRGDIYWDSSSLASKFSGEMNAEGKLAVLAPRVLAPSVPSEAG